MGHHYTKLTFFGWISPGSPGSGSWEFSPDILRVLGQPWFLCLWLVVFFVSGYLLAATCLIGERCWGESWLKVVSSDDIWWFCLVPFGSRICAWGVPHRTVCFRHETHLCNNSLQFVAMREAICIHIGQACGWLGPGWDRLYIFRCRISINMHSTRVHVTSTSSSIDPSPRTFLTMNFE